MAAKGIVDVYTNAERVAFALPNIPLDRVPIGWRFSRTVQYEVPSGLQGSDLTKNPGWIGCDRFLHTKRR
jgi:hypothetical protein